MKIKDTIIAIIVLLIVMLIIVPLPAALLDIMLVISITVSLFVLLMTLYIHEPLEFNSFPTVLLMLTLFRLALNIASTRLILGNGGDAGAVINAFGNFATGNNLVVGCIIFLIIVVIQFVVITKGAERVAEVAARFTLDAMPGKQMAIDADLNSGLIDEQGAKNRRLKIQREADFYGAMDGSSKFVKGDAIVGILITFINIIGGLVIGSMEGGMEFGEVANVYLLATIGDGLVSQIPALMVSTATGIVVTRAASNENLGTQLASQFKSQPFVFIVLGGILLVLGIIPGLPILPIWLMAGIVITLGLLLLKAARKPVIDQITSDEAAQKIAAEKRKPENVTTLLQIDLIGVELGYGIVPLVDSTQGGDLLERVIMIRRQCALDMGIIVPVIRIRDNIQLGTNDYVIKIKGIEVAKGEVMLDHLMALCANDGAGKLKGIQTIEPTFGLPAVWIPEAERERAELLGYTTVDAPSVIATHLTETIKRHSAELLNRQQVQMLVDNLRNTQPALVDEVVPKLFSLGEVQKVLCALLCESVSIRDMGTIIETLGDYGTMVRDIELLTEYVRKALARSISKKFIPNDKARVITLDPNLEKLISERVKQTEQGSFVALDQEQIQRIFLSLRAAVEKITSMGVTPIVLTSPFVRRHFKSVVAQMIPDLIVLSFNEIDPAVEVISEGVVGI